MNNQFDYSNNFSKILELSFYHEFFDDNNLSEIDLIPDDNTKAIIKNYNLLQRKKGNTFIFLKNNNSNLNNIVFKGPVQLNFVLKFKDLLFLNITDIPFQYNQKFILTTTEDKEGRLHPMMYVDKSIVESYDGNGIIAEIKLEINKNF